MIGHVGPMYIDFDEYLPYSDTISETFETNNNATIQCYNGYNYSSSKKKMCTWVNDESWDMTTKTFLDAKKKKKNSHKQ